MLITQSDRNFYLLNKDNYTHIISIVCPDEKEIVKPLHKNHIIATMWDVDKVLENKFRRYEPPTEQDIGPAMFFAINSYRQCTTDNKDFRLLVHCDAGVSRSPAITLGILWDISAYIFHPFPKDFVMKQYIEARKQWCRSLLDWNNSTSLSNFIDGRYNPGVKPNQAIINIFRKELQYFPW